VQAGRDFADPKGRQGAAPRRPALEKTLIIKMNTFL